ncbi:MAG: phytanoyl-CoA dioxygenase family protein [Armatimonadetes bacterium]|nr:phytanoyl-CoA dioxygenase family protein [Armatimonadota bacterium]
MELTYRQKQHIYEYGYVHIPGVVPHIRVDAALRAINHSVGQGMDPAQMNKYRAQTFCPEITRTPPITDLLLKTPAWELAESVIGEGQIQPVTGGQVALRFPGLQDPPGPARPHIDGLHSPNNGVPAGTLASFTMLVGILLSDLPGPDAGNFTVWPGTHRLYERYFREHGTEELLRGMGGGMPNIPLPDPVQITGRPGDIVLCHYQLAHGVTPNVSPHPRYAAFFRLSHVEHAAHKIAALTDIWLAWPGMRPVLPEARQDS